MIRLAIFAALVSACAKDWDKTVGSEEVITKIQITDPANPPMMDDEPAPTVRADGRSRLLVILEVGGDELDPMLQAVLATTSGQWVTHDAIATNTTLKIHDTHIEVPLVVGTTAGTMTVTATVKDYTRSDTYELQQVTAADVIENLTVTTDAADATAFADGQTRLKVGLDVKDGAIRTPAATAALKLSSGKWLVPDMASPSTKTIPIQGRHIDIGAVTGTQAGPLVVEATLDSLTRSTLLDLVPPTLDDVLSSITIERIPPASRAIADGATALKVKACATPRQAAIAGTMLELKTSDGQWNTPSPDPNVLAIALSSPCFETTLVPGVKPQAIAVTATIAGFSRSAALALEPAPIEQVVCSVSGSVSATGTSTLTVRARMLTENVLGKPSIGTRVVFSGTVEPGAATGYFEAPTVVLDAGDEVSSTFITYGGPTRIAFTASATAGLAAPVTCAPVVLTAPPPPP